MICIQCLILIHSELSKYRSFQQYQDEQGISLLKVQILNREFSQIGIRIRNCLFGFIFQIVCFLAALGVASAGSIGHVAAPAGVTYSGYSGLNAYASPALVYSSHPAYATATYQKAAPIAVKAYAAPVQTYAHQPAVAVVKSE